MAEARPSATRRTAPGSPTRPRCSSRSRCCAATSAATAPSPSRRPASSRPYLDARPGAAPSPGPGPGPAATRRCSRSASGPRSATRWPRQWLADHGYASTVDYLAAMCRLVLDETGLLPHANAGALYRRRAGRAAAGLAVAGDDDRVAQRRPRLPPRLARQDARAPPGHARGGRRAGHPVHHRASSSASASPAPTASTRSRPSPQSHRRHGHVQEVIVQNFLPKPGTAMHAAPPVPARRLPRRHRPGPADPARRRPPAGAAEPLRRLRRAARRRHRRLGRRLARHRRPREPRAALARARPPPRGHRGARASRWRPASRSTPSSSLDPDRWLDAGLRFPVLDRADAEGLGRDDPGAVFVQQHRSRPAPEQVDDGAEVLHIGARSTAWYSGADRSTRRRSCPRPAARRRRGRPRCSPACCSARRSASTRSSRCSRPAAPRSPRWPRSPTTCAARSVGDVVTCVHNRNINYTNVCTFKCRFCGFSKGPLSLNLRGTPYLLTLDDIAGRVPSRPPTSAPPRSACRAASTRASTATTTSTSPGR